MKFSTRPKLLQLSLHFESLVLICTLLRFELYFSLSEVSLQILNLILHCPILVWELLSILALDALESFDQQFLAYHFDHYILELVNDALGVCSEDLFHLVNTFQEFSDSWDLLLSDLGLKLFHFFRYRVLTLSLIDLKALLFHKKMLLLDLIQDLDFKVLQVLSNSLLFEE